MQQPYRIMLIEDSRTQAERLRELFENEGWETVCAGTAEAAFEELGRGRPDLIVVDYYLPGMKGDEFCRETRMNANTRGIPILMLTVEGTHTAEMRGLESGADDYLAKSVDPTILLLRVRALLRKSRGAGAVAHPADLFKRPRLLVIDDSPTYLQYLIQELSAESYRIERAACGREGLERLRQANFDCVLVNVQMPDMNGIEVCRRIAEMRCATDQLFAVIILTGHEEKEVMTRGFEAGADDFIIKSGDSAVLKSRIRALLRRKFFVEENRHVTEELKNRELEAVRARSEREAAEVRALMAEELARTNGELEKANRKLREALDVMRAITEHAAEALFMMDAEGRVTFVNPAAERMFGFTREEFSGQVLHDQIHHRRRDGSPFSACECELRRAFTAGLTLTSHEDLFFRKDGTPVDVVCSIAPILQDDQVRAAVLVVHNISEHKRSEERLRQSQKLESIGLLAGGIAHDFNNLLVGVIGNASLAQDLLAPGHPASGVLDRVVQAGEQAAQLTRQMLAYAGKGRFVVEAVDLSEIVRETNELILSSISKKIVLNLDLAADLPPVEADRSQIQQVFLNLAINASEAIGDDAGHIVFRTGTQEIGERFLRNELQDVEMEPGCYVCLEVRDSGCGMDDSTRAKIFDPFFSTKFTGRGLGLAAVAGIVRGHKGGIELTTAPATGTTLRVLLPAMASGAAASTLPATRKREEDLHGRGGVLVVDDEQIVLEVAKSCLERQGYEVLVAENGPAAIDMLRSEGNRIRLVVLDLSMPGMSGEETLPHLREIKPDLDVIISSGYSEAETLRRFRGVRITGFIQKPYRVEQLAREVKSALA